MFNLEKPFLKSIPFIITLAVTAIVVIGSMTSIIIFSDMKVLLDHHGFNNLILFFKFPLGALSVGLIITGFLLSIYRSEQTNKQINLTNKQNDIINYNSHKKDFIETTKEVNLKVLEIENPQILYKVFFPHNSEKTYKQEFNFDTLISHNEISCFYKEIFINSSTYKENNGKINFNKNQLPLKIAKIINNLGLAEKDINNGKKLLELDVLVKNNNLENYDYSFITEACIDIEKLISFINKYFCKNPDLIEEYSSRGPISFKSQLIESRLIKIIKDN